MGVFPIVIIIAAIAVASLFFVAVFGFNVSGNQQAQPIVVVVQPPPPSGWGSTFRVVAIVSGIMLGFVLYVLLYA